MPSQIQVRRGYFPEADLRQFLSCARDEVELLWWVLMADAGLRSGEVRSLVWSDLDHASLRVKGKGRKYRLVPLTRRIETIRDVCRSKFRFLDYQAVCRLSPRTLQRRFDQALKRAGLAKSNFCPHSLRHSFATRLLAAGVDIHRVGVLLGHQSTLTTCGYLHTNDDALRDARDRLDKLNDHRTPTRGGDPATDAGGGGELTPPPATRSRRVYPEVGELARGNLPAEEIGEGERQRSRPSPLDRMDDLL